MDCSMPVETIVIKPSSDTPRLGHIVFEGRSLLCLSGKAIKLFFSTSPKTLSLRFHWHQCTEKLSFQQQNHFYILVLPPFDFMWFFSSIFSIPQTPSILLTASNMALHSDKMLLVVFSSLPELYHPFFIFVFCHWIPTSFFSVVFPQNSEYYFYFLSSINTNYIILSKSTA